MYTLRGRPILRQKKEAPTSTGLPVSGGSNSPVVLMTIAFANVWTGFKINILEVRKYGLILSLIVCSKLILVDFYLYNFVIKTGLFLIGIVALAISYVYSKLEQELKLKENIDDIKDEGININDL